jgi:hypothetical protein
VYSIPLIRPLDNHHWHPLRAVVRERLDDDRGRHLHGPVFVLPGRSLDIESSTIDGGVHAINAPGPFRLCSSTISGPVIVQGSSGFVLIGDSRDDRCPANTIRGPSPLNSNTYGLEVLGDHIGGPTRSLGNAGAGPFPTTALLRCLETAPRLWDGPLEGPACV